MLSQPARCVETDQLATPMLELCARVVVECVVFELQLDPDELTACIAALQQPIAVDAKQLDVVGVGHDRLFELVVAKHARYVRLTAHTTVVAETMAASGNSRPAMARRRAWGGSLATT